VNAIDRRIKPGVKNDSMSEQMAADCRSIFRRLQGTNIVNLWILRSRWYGFSAIGKAGWVKDEATGIFAPFDVYNIDPWHIIFSPNGEPSLRSVLGGYNGIPIPSGALYFPRWGSLFSPYGESDLRDVYLAAWYIQTVEELLLHSLEVGGRPIPWIEVGDQLQGDEFDKFEAGIKADYKYYVITRTPGAARQTAVTFPNMGMLANGGAGKSETEFIRYYHGLQSRKILGTQQTQDKTGGSRALEDTRMEIAHDKTPPASQLLDATWTQMYLDAIGMVNWPSQKRVLWPVMDSSAGIGEKILDGRSMQAISAIAEQLRLKHITDTWALHLLRNAGFDDDEAQEMVDSMTDPEADLSRDPAAVATQQIAEAA
jgi:hypothetical protein